MPISDYDDVFDAAAKEWNVDPDLLRAVARQESRGDPNARSKAGAIGLMQIMPETAKGLGVANPRDAVQSIYGGAKYLSQLLDKYKNPETALAAYNAGPGRVDDAIAGRGTLPDETLAYVPAVAGHYKALTDAAAKLAPTPAPAPATAATPTPAKAGGMADMSDADFLKTTAVSPSADDDNAFLARTGGKASAPAQAAAPSGTTTASGIAKNAVAGAADAAAGVVNTATDPVGNLIGKPLATGAVFLHDALAPYLGYSRFDSDTRNMLLGDNVPQPGTRVENALGASDIKANTPAEQLVRQGVSGALTGAVLGPGGLAAPAVGAVGGVAGEVAGNAVPEWAAPAASLAGNALGAAAAMKAPLVSVKPGLPGAEALNRWITAPERADAEAATAAAAKNAMAQPADASTPSGPAVPNSVGAAASSASETGITPKQEAAYRATAEGQRLLEPQQPGIEDRAQYVQGSNPTGAEIEQSVNTARELKALGMTAPDVSQAWKEVAARNNDARSEHFQQTAGSDVDIANATAARGAQAEKDLAETWARKTPADAQPVIDAANEILSGPDSKRTLVRNAVNDVTGQLFDKDGKLETDPEMLYGVRKHIDDLMSKEAGATDPKSVRAMSNLQALKSSLDDVIENAAPGFKQYLQNFADASKRIDEMSVLQKFEPKLYDAQNRMTYNKVQTMMRQIVDSRQAPGINAAKSITDDTMARLWALRDDLRRSASAQELARAPGSDTVQNALDVAKSIAGRAALHGAATAIAGPGTGSMLLRGIGSVVSPVLEQRRLQKMTERGMNLLHPKTPLHNPLAGP